MKKKYYTTLLLYENTVSKWDVIEEAVNIEIASDAENIERDMVQYVTDLLTDGFFKKYIDRYEFELKCFDMGLELLEKERSRTNG